METRSKVGSGSAIIGAGMSTSPTFIPYIWPTMPMWIAWSGFSFGIILMMAGLYLIISGYYPNLFWFNSNSKQTQKTGSIKISFDSKNPGQRYWKLTNKINPNTGENFPVNLYRVLLKNTSPLTIDNVRVTVESTGSHPMLPQIATAQIDNQPVFTLHPNEERLIDVIAWDHPIRQAGFPAGATARQMYGDLKITVNAKDIPSVVKVFKFDYEKVPMIYE